MRLLRLPLFPPPHCSFMLRPCSVRWLLRRNRKFRQRLEGPRVVFTSTPFGCEPKVRYSLGPLWKMESSTSMGSAKITSEQVAWTGKWLRVDNTTYVDPKGIQRSWESVKRTTRIPQSTIDGVQMIAVLKRTQHDDCLVLVKQFRPPLGCYTLEFPAGLLNSGESVESAALRELQEETGFVAEVTSVSPAALCLEPGICSSADKIVCVLINGDDPANTRPQQQLDDGEFVDVVLVPIREPLTRIQEIARVENLTIDSRLFTYALGMESALGNSRPLQF